jgi:hypothetical protein
VLVSLFSPGKSLYDTGKTIDKMIEGVEDARDLWKFLRDFEEQTYPVLDQDLLTTASE